MRRVLQALSLIVTSLTVFSSLTSGQTQPANSVPAISFSQLLRQCGWSTLPTDAVATGTIRDARSSPAEGATITVTVKGREQIRYLVMTGGSSTETIINGRRGIRITDGKATVLPMAVAVSARVPVFPFLTVGTGVPSKATLKFLGQDTVGSDLADVIELSFSPDSTDISAQFRDRSERYKLWISRSTGLLVQLSYAVLSGSNSFVELPYIRKYSDYRFVDGFLFPFHQEQWLDGQPQTVIDFNEVKFNTGVTEATFAVPSIRREAQ